MIACCRFVSDCCAAIASVRSIEIRLSCSVSARALLLVVPVIREVFFCGQFCNFQFQIQIAHNFAKENPRRRNVSSTELETFVHVPLARVPIQANTGRMPRRSGNAVPVRATTRHRRSQLRIDIVHRDGHAVVRSQRLGNNNLLEAEFQAHAGNHANAMQSDELQSRFARDT